MELVQLSDSSQVQLAVYLENYDTVDKVFDRLGNNAEELKLGALFLGLDSQKQGAIFVKSKLP